MEAREKISKANTGKKRSIVVRKTFSQIAKLRKGDKNPNWKGGITSLSVRIRTCFMYRQWRSDIFTRDHFTCQWCGDARGGNLEADHIKPLRLLIQYYELLNIEQAQKCEALWDINNGRTLCQACHQKTSSYGSEKITEGYPLQYAQYTNVLPGFPDNFFSFPTYKRAPVQEEANSEDQ